MDRMVLQNSPPTRDPFVARWTCYLILKTLLLSNMRRRVESAKRLANLTESSFSQLNVFLPKPFHVFLVIGFSSRYKVFKFHKISFNLNMQDKESPTVANA